MIMKPNTIKLISNHIVQQISRFKYTIFMKEVCLNPHGGPYSFIQRGQMLNFEFTQIALTSIQQNSTSYKQALKLKRTKFN